MTDLEDVLRREKMVIKQTFETGIPDDLQFQLERAKELQAGAEAQAVGFLNRAMKLESELEALKSLLASIDKSGTLNQYQQAACRTMGDARPEILALGLAGEAGEVADYLKKVLGHGHKFDRDRLTKELGDVLWYCATLAEAYGISLDWIAQQNVVKLRARYPNGFESKRSIERNPGDE